MKIHECADRECDPRFDPSGIQILSIGTGEPRYSLSPPGHNAGIGWWGTRVIDVVSVSQSQGVSFELQYLLGDRYTRVNFELPDHSWSLDSIEHLPDLLHLGRTVAHDSLAQILDQFFDSDSPDFVPFADCNCQIATAATA